MVYTLLQDVLQQDEALQKQVEATLAEYKNRPGFYSCLLVRTPSLGFWMSLCI